METYTPGYSQVVAAFMARRRLDPNGAFFLPYLGPGISVLDCGCGPGTIMRDIERQIAPGRIIGLDFSADQVTDATRYAKAEGIVTRSRYENYDPLTVIGDFLAMNHEEAGDAKHAATWCEWGRSPNGMFSQAWVSCVAKKLHHHLTPATSSPAFSPERRRS